MVNNNGIPVEVNKKPFETVYELKDEYKIPSFEEFMESYETDGKVNYADLNGGDIGEVKGYGPCYRNFGYGSETQRIDFELWLPNGCYFRTLGTGGDGVTAINLNSGYGENWERSFFNSYFWTKRIRITSSLQLSQLIGRLEDGMNTKSTSICVFDESAGVYDESWPFKNETRAFINKLKEIKERIYRGESIVNDNFCCYQKRSAY